MDSVDSRRAESMKYNDDDLPLIYPPSVESATWAVTLAVLAGIAIIVVFSILV